MHEYKKNENEKKKNIVTITLVLQLAQEKVVYLCTIIQGASSKLQVEH